MPGIGTTIDARSCLRSVIKKRYGEDIKPGEWTSVKPSDAPPDGLGSGDADDWQITLERASGKMVSKGYAMAVTDLDEAGGARGKVLDASVALLVSKASREERAALRRRRRELALDVGAGALVGAALLVVRSRMMARLRR